MPSISRGVRAGNERGENDNDRAQFRFMKMPCGCIVAFRIGSKAEITCPAHDVAASTGQLAFAR